MSKTTITTEMAPAAIGTYSQAVQAGSTVYLSGQIPLVPQTMMLVEGGFDEQTRQVFRNLSAVAAAAGGTLDNLVKLTVYLTDLSNFQAVNEVMEEFFSAPFPARAAVGVAELPKLAQVEVEAILVFD
ncbi:MAG: RidA family protein [Candidatus Tectomicrobia bacterium]